MHVVSKHKFMRNIQMRWHWKKTLRREIENGISYHPEKINPDSEEREKNHQKRDKRKKKQIMANVFSMLLPAGVSCHILWKGTNPFMKVLKLASELFTWFNLK